MNPAGEGANCLAGFTTTGIRTFNILTHLPGFPGIVENWITFPCYG